MFFAWLIFALFLIEGIRIAGRIIKEKKKERRFIKRMISQKGGRTIPRNPGEGFRW